MAKIDVNTTQNVTIQYDTAGLLWRFIAWLIDSAVYYIFIMLMVFFVFPFILDMSESFLYLFYFLVVVFYYFYRLLLEVFTNGQSIGKKLVSIKVLKLNGSSLESKDYFLRWAYRAVDGLLSGYTVGVLSILMSEKEQRLGDMIANTTVIKLKPDRVVTLEDLQNLPDKAEYEPKYPQVTMFTDADMLALKSLLSRVQQYNNDTYYDLMAETVRNVKAKMGIENVRTHDAEFLKEIISEYVILTR